MKLVFELEKSISLAVMAMMERRRSKSMKNEGNQEEEIIQGNYNTRIAIRLAWNHHCHFFLVCLRFVW